MNPSALTEMVDRIFSNRYHIERPIGVGSASAVFVAHDALEDRSVALKIFDEGLGADDAFVERLLGAAQQAAELSHTNIAKVYDWGYDGGPFVVSELCEGGSLAALLDAGHRLTASQTLVMTLECARALHYAHQRDVAHRQLKPTNFLFADDQRLRLADFGISNIVAEAVSSRSAESVHGLRYTSPEQARGRPVSTPSDLYSVALVANEAVSGEPPAVGESAVETLMNRAESPAQLNAELQGLLPPLERCGRVDPEHRPEAEELTIALLATAETMARPAALPLVGIASLDDIGYEEDGVAPEQVDAEPGVQRLLDDKSLDDEGFDAELLSRLDGLDDVDDLGNPDDVAFGDLPRGTLTPLDTLDATPGDLSVSTLPLPAAAGGLENLAEAEPVFAKVPVSDETSTLDVPMQAAAARSEAAAFEEAEDDADDRLPWWPLVVLALLVAGAVGFGFYYTRTLNATESAIVPDLSGVQYADLGDVIGARGWRVDRLESRVDGSSVGAIVDQDPEAGVTLEEGELLVVTVSLGNAMVEIPIDVIGLTIDQAASRLGSVGLELGSVTEENSEVLAAGLVVALDEPTTQKPTGEAVALRVSAGPEERFVPETVIGMSIADATGLLTGLRLQAVDEPVFDPDAPIGTVLGSIPTPGSSLPADSQVRLLVSAGPEPVIMPDLAGLALDEAVDVIEELGLIFIDTEGLPGEDAIGSLPPGGALVDVGTEVTIILDDPEEEEDP